MKNFKRILSIVLVLAMLLISSGCSLNFFSTDSLLKPPALTGKSGEVQEAFNKLMSGKTFQLKTPVKGEYKSAFVLYDLDNDSEEEALVFYTDSSTDTSVRIAILDCVKNTWILINDIKGSGSGVYDVSFPDLNGDASPEIVVAWSLFDNKLTKLLTIYGVEYESDSRFRIETLANEYFNSKAYIDLNSNGVPDLTLVYLDDAGEVQNSYFRAFSLDNTNTIVKFSELLLDSSITSVSAINHDFITQSDAEYTRVFIDCLKSDTSIFTEVISWDLTTSKAARVIQEPAKTTTRSSKLPTQDIDNDANFEIPVTTKFFTDKKESSIVISGVVYNFTILEWLNLTGDKSDEKLRTFYNPVHSYLLGFPWGDNVTVKFDKIENQTNYCIWNASTNEIEDILFSIKFIEKQAVTKEANEFYDDNYILESTNEGDFVFEITPYGESFGITEEMIKSTFIMI
jgi:hypothetical protein